MKKKLLLFYSFLVFVNKIYTTNQKEKINYDYFLKGFLTEVNEPILEELRGGRAEEQRMLVRHNMDLLMRLSFGNIRERLEGPVLQVSTLTQGQRIRNSIREFFYYFALISG